MRSIEHRAPASLPGMPPGELHAQRDDAGKCSRGPAGGRLPGMATNASMTGSRPTGRFLLLVAIGALLAGTGCYDFTRRLGMQRDRLRAEFQRKQADLLARAKPLFEKRDRLMQERSLLDARLEQFRQALEQAKGAGQ